MHARERFDRTLEFGQRERLGDQFEHDRPVLDLAAQAADGGRENAPVIEIHRLAEVRDGVGRIRVHAELVEET